jgi:hypothetical protein
MGGEIVDRVAVTLFERLIPHMSLHCPQSVLRANINLYGAMQDNAAVLMI